MGSGGQSLALTTVREGVNRPDALGRLATWTVWLSFNPKKQYTHDGQAGGVLELSTNTVGWDSFFTLGLAQKKRISSSPRDSLVGGAGGEQAHGVPLEPRRLHLRLQRPCGRPPPEGSTRGGRKRVGNTSTPVRVIRSDRSRLASSFVRGQCPGEGPAYRLLFGRRGRGRVSMGLPHPPPYQENSSPPTSGKEPHRRGRKK